VAAENPAGVARTWRLVTATRRSENDPGAQEENTLDAKTSRYEKIAITLSSLEFIPLWFYNDLAEKGCGASVDMPL